MIKPKRPTSSYVGKLQTKPSNISSMYRPSFSGEMSGPNLNVPDVNQQSQQYEHAYATSTNDEVYEGAIRAI